MKIKKWGIVMVILGVLMIAVDFLAIPLHLASAGFGWKQISLLIVSVIILGIGLAISFSNLKNKKPD